MVQVLRVKDVKQGVVWGEVKAKVRAEWVDRLLRDQAEIASVRVAATVRHMLQDNPAIKKRAPSAAQE
jgi:hypothetical protein